MGPTNLSPYVTSLTTSGSDLYAGGLFTTAGGNPANRIAKWDGNTWTGLGSGVNNAVLALAAIGTNLYAGGNFAIAGGATIGPIARWDGNIWFSLGAGPTNGQVLALTTRGNELFVAGYFQGSGGLNIKNIAKWNGSTWSPLGSGLDNTVYALAVAGTKLYAGGAFTLAGGRISAYAASANIGAAEGRFSNLAFSTVSGFSCTFLDATIGQPYRIQTSPSLVQPLWTDFTNFAYTGPTAITDTSAGAGTNKFFRAVSP